MGEAQKRKVERKAIREAERLKGWKIDIRPYEVKVMDVDANGQVKTKGGKPVWITDDFDVQGSLADILFNRELQLTPPQAFEAYDLAKKVKASNTHVVVDNKEMALIRKAYDSLRGVSENMVEFCRRIKDAEEIQLKEVENVA